MWVCVVAELVGPGPWDHPSSERPSQVAKPMLSGLALVERDGIISPYCGGQLSNEEGRASSPAAMSSKE